MVSSELLLLLPQFFLLAALTLLLLVGAFLERRLGRPLTAALVLSQGTLALALTLLLQWRQAAVGLPPTGGWFGAAIQLLLLLAATLFLLLLRSMAIGGYPFELPLLMGFAVFGHLLLLAADDLLLAYLGLEVAALAAYPLAASRRFSPWSTEAGLKYFILGSFSSALFLLGSVFLYGGAGTVRFGELAAVGVGLAAAQSPHLWIFLLGFALLVAALLFKGAVAPFHFWVPDVYDGSPFASTAFFAVVTKVAIFGFLARLLFAVFPFLHGHSAPWLLAFGLLSLLLGTFGALRQSSLKRFVAYSGVVHGGYLLLPLATGSALGLWGCFLYLVVYLLLNLQFFAAVASLRRRRGEGPLSGVEQLVLATRSEPFGTAQLALALFSLAGIPPLAGFFAKVAVLVPLLWGGFHLTALVVVVTSVASAVYYLRLVRLMYFERFFSWSLPPSPTPLLSTLAWLLALANGAFGLLLLLAGGSFPLA